MPKLAFLSAAIAIMLLMSIAKPSSTPPQPQQCSVTFTALPMNMSIFSLSLIALELSFDVVAIGYIIGKLFPGTGIHGWLRNEYWEIAKSAIIIAAIVPIMIFISNIAVTLYGGAASSTSYVSNIGSLVVSAESNYLCGAFTITEYGNDYLTGLGLAIGLYKDLNIGLWVPIPLTPEFDPVLQSGFQISLYKNSMLESTILTGQYESLARDALLYVVAPSSLLLYFLIYLLPDAVILGIVILIPMGIFLRAFPFVRGVGGTLIAIGIGLSVIFPSLLLFVNEPVSNMVRYNFPTVSSVSGSTVSSNVGGIFAAMLEIIDNFLSQAGSYLSGLGSGFASFGTIYPALNGIIYYTFFSLLQFVLFVLDLIIIYPLIDSIAKQLGGTIRFSLSGKLKLG
ncbi:MAG: hypothetical protein QW774_02645 [Candidatus Micrarchaeaceae archaeon]